MKNKKNKIFLAIVIGALMIGGAIYFSAKKESSLKRPLGEKISSVLPPKCDDIPELPDSSLRLATKIIDGDTFLIEGGYSVRPILISVSPALFSVLTCPNLLKIPKIIIWEKPSGLGER